MSWVSIVTHYRREKKNLALIRALILSVTMTSMTWFGTTMVHQENPAAGRSYIIGHLRAAHSLRIQRQRVIDSINRIDQLGQGMRPHVGKKRRPRNYTVPRPNALWHIDGHHKLISWGIVLHGVADGYSRKVCIYINFLLII